MKRGGEYDEVYRKIVLPTLLFCDAGSVSLARLMAGRQQEILGTDAVGVTSTTSIIDLQTSCVTEYWCYTRRFQTAGALSMLPGPYVRAA